VTFDSSAIEFDHIRFGKIYVLTIVGGMVRDQYIWFLERVSGYGKSEDVFMATHKICLVCEKGCTREVPVN